MDDLPRTLQDFRRPPGVIKEDYEDFVVEEIPLYPADGAGTHTYFLLEKAGLSTVQAVHDVARGLNVGRRDIGYAGLKDARGVTRQWMSVEHVDARRLRGLKIPRIRIVETTRHRNKIRIGHLRGNAFTIRVRDTQPGRVDEVASALEKLGVRGVPNYFGEQRFGSRGDTWMVGRAMSRSDGNRRRALSAIDKRTRFFYVSAYQSYLFNRVVAARLSGGLGQLWDGDLAWLHANGAVFHVEEASVEQPRADSFEISPSGPLFGQRMTEPTGKPGELEQEVLSAERVPVKALAAPPWRVSGSRRPLRFRPEDGSIRVGADARGTYLELRFALPRGCYATSLLRELFDVRAMQG